MSLSVQLAERDWRRRLSVSWTTVPPREWVLFVLVAVGAALIGVNVLPLWQQTALWALLVLIQLVRWRRSLLRPFGAVMLYDLVRSARRSRFALARCTYAGALLVLLVLLFWQQFVGPAGGLGRLWSGETAFSSTMDQRVSDFTSSFLNRLLAVQFAAVVLLTPVCVAGAIAEEKDRRTLEYLLTTDLTNHEIVLGKLLARTAYLGSLLLLGLPFLSLLQFLGGVDPGLVLSGFIVTVMSLISLSGLSILNSVYTGKPLTAIILTYVEAAAFLLLSGLATWVFGVPSEEDLLFRSMSMGNTYLAFTRLMSWQETMAAQAQAGWRVLVPQFIGEYAIFHALVGVVCVTWAVVRLRVRNRVQAGRQAPRPFTLALRPRRKPPIGDNPMLWKELHAEPVVRFHRGGLIVAASVVSTGIIMTIYISAVLIGVVWFLGSMAMAMNAWARWMGMSVGSLLLLGIALRAATSISGERDRHTLESLLASPIDGRTLLWSKWIGSVLAVRKPAKWLLAIWGVAAVAGGIHVVAAFELVVAWAVYAVFLASLGLYLSLISRTALRATVATLLIALLISFLPWLLGRVFGNTDSTKPSSLSTNDDELTYIERRYVYNLGSGADPGRSGSIFAAGLSPSATLFSLAFSSRDLIDDFNKKLPLRPRGPASTSYTFEELGERMIVPIPGLLLYLLLSGAFWALARMQFRRFTRGKFLQDPRTKRQDHAVSSEEALLQPAG